MKTSGWLLLYCIVILLILFVGEVRKSFTAEEIEMTSSFNAVWCYDWDINTTMLSNLVSHQTFNLFLYTATVVTTNNSLSYLMTDNEITTILNTIRNYNGRFKIYAWVASYPPVPAVDLSTSELRQALVNSVVACANKGFNGIQDDVEWLTAGTTPQNQVDYWNAETVALHAINKKNVPFAYSRSWELPYFVQIQADYIAIILYGGTPWEESMFKEAMHGGLTGAISPCILSMETGSGGGASLGTQFTWVDYMIATYGPYSKLTGFALYNYEEISSNEWIAWDNWACKNPFVEPPPEPPIPPPPAEYYTVIVSAGAGGQVTPTGSNQVLVGINFSMHATANIDYTFSYWTRNGMQVSINANYTITDGTANSIYEMVAYFTYNPPPVSTFTVIISSSTGGSTVPSGTQTSNVGTPISITATADGGYTFSHWLRDGNVYSISNPVSISGYANQTITLQAVFEANPPPEPPTPPIPSTYTINIETVVGGSTNYTGSQTVNVGDSLTVQAEPNDNYMFSYWLLDNVDSGANLSITITGTAGSTYNLRPVFQHVSPPPPPEPLPISPPIIGPLGGTLLPMLIGKFEKQKSINFDDLINALKKANL